MCTKQELLYTREKLRKQRRIYWKRKYPKIQNHRMELTNFFFFFLSSYGYGKSKNQYCRLRGASQNLWIFFWNHRGYFQSSRNLFMWCSNFPSRCKPYQPAIFVNITKNMIICLCGAENPNQGTNRLNQSYTWTFQGTTFYFFRENPNDNQKNWIQMATKTT